MFPGEIVGATSLGNLVGLSGIPGGRFCVGASPGKLVGAGFPIGDSLLGSCVGNQIGFGLTRSVYYRRLGLGRESFFASKMPQDRTWTSLVFVALHAVNNRTRQ